MSASRHGQDFSAVNTENGIFKEDKTMQEFIHNIAALFKVKTIISLVCIFVFAYLAIKQIITPDNVMTIVSMVIAFYFGTQAGKDK